MKLYLAPIIIATIGITGAIIVQEPAAAILSIGIALLGLSINRKAN